MSYKHPEIKLQFNKSTFEQYEPSTVSVEWNFEYGHEPDIKVLSSYERKRFVKMAIDRLMESYMGEK